jgi:hypothetical protein
MKTQPIRSRVGRWFGTGRRSFRSTVIPAWLFWVVTCATAVIAGIGVAYVGSPHPETPLETSTIARSSQSAPNSSAEAAPGEDRDAGRPAESDAAAGGTDENGSAAAEDDGLAQYQGTAIQVLNASSEEGAAETLASRLEAEGFAIEAVETARRIYNRTTIFWTPKEGRAAALGLAEHFGWRAAPKPANLTDEIPVHVVVGEDGAS